MVLKVGKLGRDVSRSVRRTLGAKLAREAVDDAYLEAPAEDELRHIDAEAAAVLLDELFMKLVGHESLCRLWLGRLADRLLQSRAYHELGFARLSDFATERLGVLGRELQSMAEVWRAIVAMPALGRAFQCGRLNWTKVRMIARICRVAEPDEAERWIALAEQITSRELANLIAEQRSASRTGASTTDVGCEAGRNQTAIRGLELKRVSTGATILDGEEDDRPDDEPRVDVLILVPRHLTRMDHHDEG